VLCYHQGKYKQAEELHLGALQNLEKAYGQNNPKVHPLSPKSRWWSFALTSIMVIPQVAQCLDELSKTWAKMGKYDEAKAYLQRALVRALVSLQGTNAAEYFKKHQGHSRVLSWTAAPRLRRFTSPSRLPLCHTRVCLMPEHLLSSILNYNICLLCIHLPVPSKYNESEQYYKNALEILKVTCIPTAIILIVAMC